MSPSTEIIDISFESPGPGGEPALPMELKGEHLRFIGWPREYTIRIENDTLTIEGPFQDDNPNASEFYQVSQTIASRWIEVLHGSIRIRIPGRGKWGIGLTGNPNYELQIARLKIWLANLRGPAAVKQLEEELRQEIYHLPKIYAFLQCLSVSGTALVATKIGTHSAMSIGVNLAIAVLFVLLYGLVGMLRHRLGLWLGVLLNIGLLAMPFLETALLGERASAFGVSLPLFAPFCLSPLAVLIPLAMGAYGNALLEHPRQRQLIRTDE